jgi:hypothetical protein
MNFENLPHELERIIDCTLAKGCPCRFPRFRATCERSSKDAGVPGYTTWEQSLLVHLFEAKVPRRDIQSESQNKESGHCAICGVTYTRTSQEYFRDAWIERLHIQSAASDIGPDFHTPVPHCCPFYAAGPHGRKDELMMLNLHYPQLPEAEWLAWLGAGT